MKRFRFKLQTLLDQRLKKEEALLAELAEVRREEAEEIRCLQGLQAQHESVRMELAQALSGRCAQGDLERTDEYVKALADDIKVQKLTIEAVQARVEEKRLMVVEAMKDRQVLEALRDKQEQAYMAACALAELNESDAMSSLRYARGM